jgi:hypothetical protein
MGPQSFKQELIGPLHSWAGISQSPIIPIRSRETMIAILM